MGVQLRWVGEADLDRVAEVRARAFGHAEQDLESFRTGLRSDPRAKPGDYLLAELNGEAIGTLTVLDLTMWMRGSALPCQGVAFVATSKTHRRGCGASGAGVASRLMQEALRMAHQRGQVLTALMPFRASYYEHFGYGVVERRHTWTVPMAILPADPVEGFDFGTGDEPRVLDIRNRMVRAGQCDVERSTAAAAAYRSSQASAMVFVDRSADDEAASFAIAHREEREGRNVLRIRDWSAASPQGFLRLLCFCASLRDQYSALVIELPSDWPLNRLLRESQFMHRLANHPTASYLASSRMMVRVLDHAKLLERLHLDDKVRGEAAVAIHECEGQVSRLNIRFESGRATATPTTATPVFECEAKTWAAIACGDLPATLALRHHLASGDLAAARLLDVLSDGPVPFCQENF